MTGTPATNDVVSRFLRFALSQRHGEEGLALGVGDGKWYGDAQDWEVYSSRLIGN